MSNFRLRAPDCVFIHIPKTGGSSIRRGLWQDRYDPPAFGTFEDDWRGLYHFAFIRHPLDRFISAYADFTQLRGYEGSIQDFAKITCDTSIDGGASRACREERIRHHTLPQTDPFNGLSRAQDIYRFEDFPQEIARLATKTGLTYQSIPQKRQTHHASWRDLLTPDLIGRLTDFYAQDFSDLGYPLP
jgi:hypothetical protein